MPGESRLIWATFALSPEPTFGYGCCEKLPPPMARWSPSPLPTWSGPVWTPYCCWMRVALCELVSPGVPLGFGWPDPERGIWFDLGAWCAILTEL